MNTTQLRKIRDLILSTNGTVFGCEAIKRSTGEVRSFNARTFEDTNSERDQEHNMLTVIEMNNTKKAGRKAYRTIALEGVLRLHIGGETYHFEPNTEAHEQSEHTETVVHGS